MQMPKEIREKPFDRYSGLKNNRVRYQVNAFSQIHNHEKIYIVELISNPKYQKYSWRAEQNDKNIRIIISKKQKDYAVFLEDSQKSSRPDMSKYIDTYNYCDISEQSKKVLGNLLNVKDEHISELCALFNRYRSAKCEERRQKNGYINDDVVNECPTEFPKGFLEFVKEEVIGNDKTLIYKRGGVHGTCACCGQKVRSVWGSEKFRQHQVVRCPNCWEPVQCILEDSQAWKADYVQNVITMERQGNRIWFRQYHIHRDNSAVYENLESYIEEIARYVIIGNKSAAWRNEGKYGISNSVYKFADWERYQSADVYDGGYKFYCENIPETVQGTVLQYAELEKYRELKPCNTVKYCRYFIKYPVFEFLMKKGMHQIITDKLYGYASNRGKDNAVLWERKKLKECFKFPIRLLNLFSPEDWTLDKINDCYMYYKKGFCDSDIYEAIYFGMPVDEVIKIAQHTTVSKLHKYIDSQKTGTIENSRYIFNDYKDYLSDCEKLGFDMKSKSVLFPKNLKSAHQRTAEMVKYEASKKLDEDILKVYKKLLKKAFKEDGLIIRPAKNSKELIKEGQALHHCVGGYAKDVAEGKTAIFFVRIAGDKKKPYFTLEYRNGAVVQCRTLNNRSYETEEKVKVFVEHWLKKIKKGA